MMKIQVRQINFNLSRYFIMVFLASTLLISGCASVSKTKVTNGHLHDLRVHFVGRKFQFLTDWHTYSVVYKGRPSHWYDMNNNNTPQVQHGLVKRGTYSAHNGDKAVFTNIKMWTYHSIALYFKNDNGEYGILRIGTPNKEVFASEFWEELTNETASVDWIENQLTNGTIKFIDEKNTSATSTSTDIHADEANELDKAQQEKADEAFFDSF